MQVWKYALIAGAALAVMSCDDDGTGPEDANVGVRFDVVEPASGDIGVLEGSNGTLEITDVRMIADEFRLAVVDGACDDDAANEDCQELETEARFVGLPLPDGDDTEIRQIVLPGSYVALSFEAQAADDATQVPESLLEEIREEFPEWPAGASTVVTGAFTPSGGDEQPFIVFIAADQRVNLDFTSPLEVTDEDDERMVTVMLNLETWFANEDGSVVDLSLFDFETTGELVDLTTRFEDGFAEAEVEE